MENSIKNERSSIEDMKILEGIIKGDEDCINAIYSQMKVKNDNDEDIQYYKKEIQSIKNIVDNYLKEKARADKLEKEYSAMLTESDENECDYKRVLKENEELKEDRDKFKKELLKRITYCNELEKDLFENCSNYVIPIQKVKDKIKELNRKINNGGKTYGGYGGCVINSENIIKLQNQIEALKELLEGRK